MLREFPLFELLIEVSPQLSTHFLLWALLEQSHRDFAIKLVAKQLSGQIDCLAQAFI